MYAAVLLVSLLVSSTFAILKPGDQVQPLTDSMYSLIQQKYVSAGIKLVNPPKVLTYNKLAADHAITVLNKRIQIQKALIEKAKQNEEEQRKNEGKPVQGDWQTKQTKSEDAKSAEDRGAAVGIIEGNGYYCLTFTISPQGDTLKKERNDNIKQHLDTILVNKLAGAGVATDVDPKDPTKLCVLEVFVTGFCTEFPEVANAIRLPELPTSTTVGGKSASTDPASEIGQALAEKRGEKKEQNGDSLEDLNTNKSMENPPTNDQQSPGQGLPKEKPEIEKLENGTPESVTQTNMSQAKDGNTGPGVPLASPMAAKFRGAVLTHMAFGSKKTEEGAGNLSTPQSTTGTPDSALAGQNAKDEADAKIKEEEAKREDKEKEKAEQTPQVDTKQGEPELQYTTSESGARKRKRDDAGNEKGQGEDGEPTSQQQRGTPEPASKRYKEKENKTATNDHTQKKKTGAPGPGDEDEEGEDKEIEDEEANDDKREGQEGEANSHPQNEAPVAQSEVFTPPTNAQLQQLKNIAEDAAKKKEELDKKKQPSAPQMPPTTPTSPTTSNSSSQVSTNGTDASRELTRAEIHWTKTAKVCLQQCRKNLTTIVTQDSGIGQTLTANQAGFLITRREGDGPFGKYYATAIQEPINGKNKLVFVAWFEILNNKKPNFELLIQSEFKPENANSTGKRTRGFNLYCGEPVEYNLSVRGDEQRWIVAISFFLNPPPIRGVINKVIPTEAVRTFLERNAN